MESQIAALGPDQALHQAMLRALGYRPNAAAFEALGGCVTSALSEALASNGEVRPVWARSRPCSWAPPGFCPCSAAGRRPTATRACCSASGNPMEASPACGAERLDAAVGAPGQSAHPAHRRGGAAAVARAGIRA